MKITLLKGNPNVVRVVTSVTPQIIHHTCTDLHDEKGKVIFKLALGSTASISQYGATLVAGAATDVIVNNIAIDGSAEEVRLVAGQFAVGMEKLEKAMLAEWTGLNKAAEAVEVIGAEDTTTKKSK